MEFGNQSQVCQSINRREKIAAIAACHHFGTQPGVKATFFDAKTNTSASWYSISSYICLWLVERSMKQMYAVMTFKQEESRHISWISPSWDPCTAKNYNPRSNLQTVNIGTCLAYSLYFLYHTLKKKRIMWIHMVIGRFSCAFNPLRKRPFGSLTRRVFLGRLGRQLLPYTTAALPWTLKFEKLLASKHRRMP